jgi:hypothetical protein
MSEPSPPLWDTFVDRTAPMLAAACLGLGSAGLCLDWLGGAGAPSLYACALALAFVLVRRVSGTSVRPSLATVYHSDEDGLLVAPKAGRMIRLPWVGIIEMCEGPLGTVTLVTRDAKVCLPRRVARREAFGMAAFERIVPRLAGELWDGLANGRMVVVAGGGHSSLIALTFGLAVGAAIIMPTNPAWCLALVAVVLAAALLVRWRGRSVFMSSRGIGDRERFIAWDGAELDEGRWTLAVRDPSTGWVARIPRSAVNYHAIAVVARTAQALTGSGVESVAFRSAHDSGGVRIVVEGSRPGGGQPH